MSIFIELNDIIIISYPITMYCRQKKYLKSASSKISNFITLYPSNVWLVYFYILPSLLWVISGQIWDESVHTINIYLVPIRGSPFLLTVFFLIVFFWKKALSWLRLITRRWCEESSDFQIILHWVYQVGWDWLPDVVWGIFWILNTDHPPPQVGSPLSAFGEWLLASAAFGLSGRLTSVKYSPFLLGGGPGGSIPPGRLGVILYFFLEFRGVMVTPRTFLNPVIWVRFSAELMIVLYQWYSNKLIKNLYLLYLSGQGII